MDYSQFGAKEFETLCARLLRASGYELAKQSERGSDAGFDFILADNIGQTGIAEVKHFKKPGSYTAPLMHVAVQLGAAKIAAGVDFGLLIVSILLPQKLKEEIETRERITVWDSRNLDFLLDNHPGVALDLDSQLEYRSTTLPVDLPAGAGTHKLELHYHFTDDSHAMNALVRNKCEAEALAVFLRIAGELGIPLQIESTAFTEGGLREIWQFAGKNSNQLTLLLAVAALLFSRVPVSDPEQDVLDKEVAKATLEEKKLNIEKLRREHVAKPSCGETISAVADLLEDDHKVVSRRSNFYRFLLDYPKVAAVGFGYAPSSKVHPTVEHTVRRHDFSRFVFPSGKLPIEVVEGAQIEIVAPVLVAGKHQWKGMYLGKPITFSMLDREFKAAVLRGAVSFQCGTSIECILTVHRKLDEVGEINITGYTVTTVLAKTDATTPERTMQGKRHSFNKRAVGAQTELFEVDR